MIRLSDLIGQDAISVQSAQQTGAVKGIGVQANRIVNVGLSDRTIPSSAVRSFEGDVLTFDEGDSTTDPSIVPHDPRRSKVLDVNGDALGVIEDLLITGDGIVDTIELDGGRTMPGTRLLVIGSYAAIVGDALPPPTV